MMAMMRMVLVFGLFDGRLVDWTFLGRIVVALQLVAWLGLVGGWKLRVGVLRLGLWVLAQALSWTRALWVVMRAPVAPGCSASTPFGGGCGD